MLIALILIPILLAIAIGFGAPRRVTAVTGGALTLLMTLWSQQQCLLSPDPQATFSCWDSGKGLFQLGLNYHDGMSMVMALLTAIVLFAATLGIKNDHPGAKMKYISVLLMGAGAMGAFLATDIIFFFAFHELALIPTFLMIGMYGRGDRRSIAWKTTLYLAAASIVLLVGIVLICLNYGTTSIDQILKLSQANPFMSLNGTVAASCLFAGFAALVALFPFHSWAAPAYASAPASIAMMHAGVLKKFGLFGLIRFLPVFGLGEPESPFVWISNILLVLLACNVLWVGYVTINQRRLDLMLGNSSVMHMGYIYLAIASIMVNTNPTDGMPDLAYKAAIFLMFAHGLGIALLFFLAGVVERRTGSLEFSTLGGLGKKLPRLAFLFGIAAMASIGLPGFANFPGELMVFFSGFIGWVPDSAPMGPLQYATIACLWGLVISAVYMLRAYRNIFQGETSVASERACPLTISDQVTAAFLIVIIVAIGCCPNLILNMLF